MTRRFEAEPAIRPPADFLDWYHEITMLADLEGEAAVVGMVMTYAPVECVRAFAYNPVLWIELLTRARYADRCRFAFGVYAGRRGVGV
jgi:hypothetical protein